MLTYDELIDLTLTETGQFIVDLDTTMLDCKKIELMIERELNWFSKYYPVRKRASLFLFDGKQFTEEQDKEIPFNILSIQRAYNQNSTTFLMWGRPRFRNTAFTYNNGILNLMGESGVYDVEYSVYHKYDRENQCIETLTSESPFVNLFIAKFMISIGRSRKAFLLNDLPLSMDSDSMVGEGQELYQSTREYIMETSRYDYAIVRR